MSPSFSTDFVQNWSKRVLLLNVLQWIIVHLNSCGYGLIKRVHGRELHIWRRRIQQNLMRGEEKGFNKDECVGVSAKSLIIVDAMEFGDLNAKKQQEQFFLWFVPLPSLSSSPITNPLKAIAKSEVGYYYYARISARDQGRRSISGTIEDIRFVMLRFEIGQQKRRTWRVGDKALRDRARELGRPMIERGPEDPQTPPVPQDEDEREPMFVQAHDPDYVPEPVYPEYIPLEDEHEFPAEEQPLPPIDSPTTESPGYVTESDPEEDLEEYEDDETEDGLVDYPMDGGDDGDEEDGDSSREDTMMEDRRGEDEEDEEEEEHLAPLTPTTEDSRSRISQRVDMDSQRVNLLIGDRITLQKTVWMVEEEAYASRDLAYSIGLSTPDTAIAAEYYSCRVLSFRHSTRDMRREMSDMQAELLALREPQRRARQPGPEARIPDHQEASGDADSHI
ncbi:hypothetical protein Tco_0595153 [Tanacetum coccineum]